MLRASTAVLVVAVLLGSSLALAPASAGAPAPSAPSGRHSVAGASPIGPIGGRLFDVRTGLPNGDSNSATGLAIDPGTGTVYAANEFAGTVTAFNESTGVVEQSRTLAAFVAGSFPAGLLLDTAHHRLFVSISTRFNLPSGAGWVLVLNESTLLTEQNISLAGSPSPPFEPTYLAYDDPTDQLFVENSTAGLVAILDLAAASVTRYLACPVSDCAEHGYGLLDLPQFHTLVVPTCAQALWLVNVSNDTTRTLLTGPSLGALMAWAVFDSVDQVLWVENYSYFGAIGSFLGYNVSTLALLADVPGAPPRETGMSYDPQDNLLVTINLNGSQQIASYRASDASLVATSGTNGSVSNPFLTLTVDGATHRAIAGGPGNGSTVAYQLPSLTVQKVYDSFPIAQNAATTDPSRGTYLVASSSPNTLRAELESNGSTLWQVALPAGSSPVGLAFDGGTDRTYVADASDGSLRAYDAGTGTAVATASLGVASGALCALLFDPVLGLIFVGSTQPAEVLVFNVSQGIVVGTYSMPGQSPCRLALDPSDDDLVILSTTAAGTVYDLAPTPDGSFTPGSVVSAGPSPLDLAVDSSGRVYVLANSGVELDRFANTSGALLGTLSLAASPASELALDPTDGLLFLGATHTGTIEVVQTSSMAVVGQFDDAGIVGPIVFDDPSGVLAAPTSATGQVLVAAAVPVPSSPTGLLVTAGNTSLSVTWAPPTSSGPDPLTGYRLLLQIAGPSGWALTLNTSGLSADFSNLTNGIVYNVSVAGVSAAGVGTSRATASVTPAGIPFPPTNVSITALGTSGLAVNWSPPATDDGAAITDYVVHYYRTDGGSAASFDAGVQRGALVGGLDPGTNYSVYVTATNSVGISHPSASAQATTSAAAPASSSAYLWAGGILALGLIALGVAFVGLRRRRRRRPEAANPADETPLAPAPDSAEPTAGR